MKSYLLTLVLVLTAGLSSPAALVRLDTSTIPKSIPPAPHGHKFLFIADVSNSMERFEDCGRQTLFELINSGLDGQMQVGDSFGLWAFNERVMAGEFPVQVWDPTNHLFLATSSSNYLSGLKYEDRSRLDVVVQSLSNIVQKVQDLNVFIISDDRAKLKGTAFDIPINEIYRKRSREMKRENKPFVTSLLFRKGQLTTGQVVLAGEGIKLPNRPAPLPWPPPPVPKTNQTLQAKVPRPRSAPQDPGRTIMITKQTIQRDKEALQASLKANFAGQTSNTATSVVAPNAENEQTPQAGNPSLNEDPSPVPAPQESKLDSPATINPAASEPQGLPDNKEAESPELSLASLRPQPLTVSARETPIPSSDSSTQAITTPSITAVVSPPAASARSFHWITMGAGCLLLGVALFVWSLSRRRPRISSITQSLDP